MKKVLIALEILVIVLVGGFLIFIYSGWYNIAATAGHYGIVRWTLETVMENSVERHAQGIPVPAPETLDLQAGFRHFDQMCVMCHGAPGVDPSEIGKGLVPDPPRLGEAVHEWTSEELFWIVRNGIKMSGMPALGPTHRDEDLWNVVGFIRTLPEISPKEYQELVSGIPEGHH